MIIFNRPIFLLLDWPFRLDKNAVYFDCSHTAQAAALVLPVLANHSSLLSADMACQAHKERSAFKSQQLLHFKDKHILLLQPTLINQEPGKLASRSHRENEAYHKHSQQLKNKWKHIINGSGSSLMTAMEEWSKRRDFKFLQHEVLSFIIYFNP